MKSIYIFLAGLVIGLSSLFFYGQIANLLQQYGIFQRDTEKVHHHAEGKKLQDIEFIDEDDYKSTEGNQATLYQLKDQCKLVIQMNGETVFAYQTIYFHHEKILNIIESGFVAQT